MGKGEPCVITHFPPPSPSGERDSLAIAKQGEGLSRRGQTPEQLLRYARSLRTNQTQAEDKLWGRLRAGRLHGLKFRRQVAFSADYIADFVHAKSKLVIELDGSQHADKQAYDNQRTRFFESEGYRVIRFWNNDVLQDIDSVLTAVHFAVTSAPLPGASRLSLPPEGEGR
jgi:very-short-patch-repair endonuclease